PNGGNFDGGGSSYSFDEMLKSTPMTTLAGTEFSYEGMAFQWANSLAGTYDNTVYSAGGAVVPVTPVDNATGLGIIGAGNNGPTTGGLLINYTDGTAQSVQVRMSDWTLNGGKYAPSYGNQLFWAYPYRNTPTGQQNVWTFLFYQEFRLTPGKTVKSITPG